MRQNFNAIPRVEEGLARGHCGSGSVIASMTRLFTLIANEVL